MTRAVAFAAPGDLATPTGGYAYDRRVIAELRTLGWAVEVVGLGEGFPHPTEATRAAAGARLRALPAGLAVVVDGHAYGVMEDAARSLRAARPLVALVHHPLALETGLAPAAAAALRRSETAALAAAGSVVATSAATADLLARDYAVPRGRIVVAPPGTDRPATPARANGSPPHLLAVGAVVPRKGYDVLLTALANLADLPWRLTIAGALDRAPETAAALYAQRAAAGLEDRVTIAGAVAPERLAALYAGADLFVLASRFEGYGMAYAEAVAHGLPVVGTNAGAIADTVAPEARVLVPADDAAALAAALRPLLAGVERRARLAAAARTAAARLPTWPQTAALLAQAIERAG